MPLRVDRQPAVQFDTPAQPHKRMKKTVKTGRGSLPWQAAPSTASVIPQVPVRRDAVRHLRRHPPPEVQPGFQSRIRSSLICPRELRIFRHHRIAVDAVCGSATVQKTDTICCALDDDETGNIPLRFSRRIPPVVSVCIRRSRILAISWDNQRNARKHRMKGEDTFRIGFHTRAARRRQRAQLPHENRLVQARLSFTSRPDFWFFGFGRKSSTFACCRPSRFFF